MKDQIIRTKDGFELIAGYVINKSASCYKSENNDWVIIDSATGTRIDQGYKTYSDALKGFKNKDWSILDKYKKDPKYQKAVDDLNK